MLLHLGEKLNRGKLELNGYVAVGVDHYYVVLSCLSEVGSRIILDALYPLISRKLKSLIGEVDYLLIYLDSLYVRVFKVSIALCSKRSRSHTENKHVKVLSVGNPRHIRTGERIVVIVSGKSAVLSCGRLYTYKNVGRKRDIIIILVDLKVVIDRLVLISRRIKEGEG